MVWTIVQLPALPKRVHYRNYWANIYGANKNVQSCVCLSPVVGRGSSTTTMKEETKLAVTVFYVN